MNINDYKDDINKIVPSESFISETEALMKAARDRQLIAPRSITVRRNVLRSLAAAAAVLVCAAAVNLYIRNMNTGIVGGEKSADTEIDSAAYEDIISSVNAPAADETAVSGNIETDASDITETAEKEETEEIAEIEETEEIEEIISTAETADISDEVPETEDVPVTTAAAVEEMPIAESVPAETSAEKIPEETGSTESIMPAAEPPAVPQEETEELLFEYEEDSSYDAGLYTDEEFIGGSDVYDHTDALNAGGINTGAGLGAGGMYDSDDGGAAVTEEEECFEEEAGQSNYGGYSYGYGGYGGTGWTASVSNTYSASYNMNSTDMDILSAKDEVYVPDSIDMLDKGTYYMKVSSGKEKADISSDDDLSLDGVIGCIDNISYNNSPVYSDKKTDMDDCRGKIEICSAQSGGGDTVMFEVMYNDEYMVINRYDNGTVSSERYTISESDVKKADSVLSSCIH